MKEKFFGFKSSYASGNICVSKLLCCCTTCTQGRDDGSNDNE